MKNLIINADDFGLNESFNRGTLELIGKGIVTSVSVMVKQPYVDPKELLVFGNLSIGLHLELENDDTTESIENQIAAFKIKFGKMPSHLDGHQHCHLLPNNIEKVARMATKYNLPVRSRFPDDRNFIIKKGIKTPELFISWHPKRTPVLLEKLKNPIENIIEMVCHPGCEDKNSEIKYNKQREDEKNFLKSKEFLNAIKEFKLISYNKLK